MIIDHLLNLRNYQKLHSRFSDICHFLEKNEIATFDTGKYSINEYAYVNIEKMQTRKKENAFLEAHKKYIDIQLVFTGLDTMGWKPLFSCKKIQSNYDEVKDLIFFKDTPDLFVPVAPSFFTIFFPEDAHMPLIGTGIVHKAVIKLQV